MLFTILSCNIPFLQEKFDKLNVKASKYSTELLSYTIVRTFEEKISGRIEKYTEIKVSGVAPTVGNYKLVGVISKLDDINIVHSVPGEEIPVEYRTTTFSCDHCHIERYRKEVVIVRDGTSYKQLGKTCLKDYLGVDVEQIVNRFMWISELIESAKSYEFSSRQEYFVSPRDYLAYVNLCVRKLGYLKTSDWEKTPTKTDAFNIMFPNKQLMEFIDNRQLYIEDQDFEAAEKAITFANSMTGTNDFVYNVKNIINKESIGFRYCGYLAAIIPMMWKAENESKNKQGKESNWVGEIKERIEFVGKLIFQKEIDSSFGLSSLYNFVDSNGNIYTWFSSSDKELETGKEYNVTGTIKSHVSYKDIKQNNITRAKISPVSDLITIDL